MRDVRRALVIGIGLLEAAAPRRIIRSGERLAFRNPESGRLRTRTIPIARLEGLAVVWLVGREKRLPTSVRSALVAVGLVLALVPRTTVELSLHVAYENADELELKRWVVPAARVLGAIYVVAGLFSTPADAPTETQTERRD